MVSKLRQGHEDSEYVLSFEIGQRDCGFYSARTDRITDTPSAVLVYIYSDWYQINRKGEIALIYIERPR